MVEAFIKGKDELEALAHQLSQIAASQPKTVVRYKQTIYDSMFTERGRHNVNRCGLTSTYNLEDMQNQVYSSVRGEELFAGHLPEFEHWRAREEIPFLFQPKGIELPAERYARWVEPPGNIEKWDQELIAFTSQFKGVRITREFGVEQQVIVNSNGGLVMESRPFFCIYYRQGYEPCMVTRTLGAYVVSDADIDRFAQLIAYLPDPTPEGRIRASKTFSEAFAHLYEISHQVEFADLQSAGLRDHLTHPVIMLSGVPVHEIFGHQFEEPIQPLHPGEESLFPIGRNVENHAIRLCDNPHQTIEGFEVLGSYPYDCYGRPSRPWTHIAGARVQEHIGGEYIDRRNIEKYLGVRESPLVGGSRQGDDGLFPQPRMSCTVLEGEEDHAIDWEGKVLMVPYKGYVLDGNFFKVMASECYRLQKGQPRRIVPLESSRAIYDAMIGMHILPGKSYHVGACLKPAMLEEGQESEVGVSFYSNHQMWDHLTLRSL